MSPNCRQKDAGALKGKSMKTKNAPHVCDLIVPPKTLIKKNSASSMTVMVHVG